MGGPWRATATTASSDASAIAIWQAIARGSRPPRDAVRSAVRVVACDAPADASRGAVASETSQGTAVHAAPACASSVNGTPSARAASTQRPSQAIP
jgi:hypothetical protein